ncbi:MAG: flagellar hook-length control protein FliK [Rhodocyclaceae bacterium]|nr:flagellar hook-length control protein FliK [Rhodocyclaceae bacterium]
MALIPPDVGLRMRLQAETSLLHPASPVQGIPSDLPELQTGQMFTARIQEVLPENTYRALVAGKSLTLSLPEGAKSGDVLELVVVDRTPRMLLAKLAEPATQSAPNEQPYRHATLSPTAQLIGKLLLPQGQKPEPAVLNGGQPLLATAPDPSAIDIAARLAPKLENAVGQSGLFYEAHQARWIAGKLPAEALLQEPQGKESLTAHNKTAAGSMPSSAPQDLAATNRAGSTGQFSGAETAGRAKEAFIPASVLQSIPEELRPLVQQQLDAAATQRMVWHGEIWPEQQLEWEIERDARQPDSSATEAAPGWSTRLALTSPRLGRVEASLQLNPSGINIQINAADATVATEMRSAIAELAGSLEAAGLTAPFIQVGHAD